MITNLYQVECRVGDLRTVMNAVTMMPRAAEEASSILIADRCNVEREEVKATARLLVAGLLDKPGEDFRDREARKKRVSSLVRKFLAFDAEDRQEAMSAMLRGSLPGRFATAGSPLPGTIIAVSNDVFDFDSSPESARGAA